MTNISPYDIKYIVHLQWLKSNWTYKRNFTWMKTVYNL